MKTQIKLILAIIMIYSSMLNDRLIAQYCGPYGTGFEIQTTATYPYLALTVGTGACGGSGSLTFPGMGINVTSPNYMLDMLCDPSVPTNMDANISSLAYLSTPANATGYRIGGNMFLWYAGDISSYYSGVGAGSIITSGLNYNTLIGFHAGNGLNSGSQNTVIGSNAGILLSSGSMNTIIGCDAGSTLTTGTLNTLIGWSADGQIGGGSWNTVVGINAGYSNYGDGNCFYGKSSGGNNTTGKMNSFYGSHSADGNVDGDYSVAMGYESESSNHHNNYNVVIGYQADNYGGSSGTSDYNVLLGANCGVYNSTVSGSGNYDVLLGYNSFIVNGSSHSAAIGDYATAVHSNQIILGNDAQFVGIGMSSNQTGPMANLEIKTDSNLSAPPWGQNGFIGNGNFGTGNFYSGTGFSGLKFTDLTSNSTPVVQGTFTIAGDPYPAGVLSVDGYGNVIYVPAPSGGGIGTCSAPTVLLSGGGAYDLGTNNGNFNFYGNGGTGTTDVAIGYTPCYTPTAKLDINQTSGASYGSIGLSVFNWDNGGTDCTIYSSPDVIGIQSIMPSTSGPYALKVAGWFEADPVTQCVNGATNQYALFVPQNGGYVSFGFPWNFGTLANNAYQLMVNGSAWLSSGTLWTTSDSTIKTNVSAISNPFAMINKLNGIKFNYKQAAITDSGSTGNQYGFLAQQVERVLPGIVKTGNNGLKGVAYMEIIPWLVEGMKQQQQTIDSLRTTLNTLLNCCENSDHSATHHSIGNAGDSNSTTTNVEDVSLSGVSDAPLLYQNTPNPFSSGTKINYYLPEGTQGATIMFYDSYGNQLKIVTLSETGNGTLNVTSDNLTAGIYSYSLVVNGKVIDTKRMILQK